jgi:hypothetical protein
MRHFSNGMDGDWNQVSVTAPCPICGADADCRTHSEEAFACCVQRPSDWRLNNGGWLHRVVAESGRALGVLAGSVVAATTSVVAGSVVAASGVPASTRAGSARAGNAFGAARGEWRTAGTGPSGVMS